MMTPQELKIELAQFSGTEGYHKLSMIHGRLVCTDGVKWLANEAGAFWLIDVIASYQRKCAADPMLSQMQFWTLKRAKNGRGCTVTCNKDKGQKAFSQRIPYTDFPLNEFDIWVEAGMVGETPCMVAMLPNER